MNEGMKPTPPLLKAYQAAEILGCSTRTVKTYFTKKTLLAWWRGGERVTNQEAIDKFLAEMPPVDGPRKSR